MMSENLKLWNSVMRPHDDAMKSFTRSGGFRGTAIDPMWLIHKATELWGPMGGLWGIDSVTDAYIDGPDGQVLHVTTLDLFYPIVPEQRDGRICGVSGQTFLVYKKRNGELVFDEEAPKKSRTDAISKALSWLGFGAAVYMGMFDGNKYVDLRPGAQDGGDDPQSNPYPPGVHELTPLRVDVQRETDEWTWWTVRCQDRTEFSTFEQNVVDAVQQAVHDGEVIKVRFEAGRKAGTSKAVEVLNS